MLWKEKSTRKRCTQKPTCTKIESPPRSGLLEQCVEPKRPHLSGWPVVGWSRAPIVSDSIFTNLHNLSARLTRALSCGTIARQHVREMQRHATDRVAKCSHCNEHARSAGRVRGLGQQALTGPIQLSSEFVRQIRSGKLSTYSIHAKTSSTSFG